MSNKNNLEDLSLEELLYRETDDCTAKPVFIIMRKQTAVSPSAVKQIDIHELRNSLTVGESYVDIGNSSFDIYEEIENREFDMDEDYDNLPELLQEIALEEGLKCNDFEGESFYFWSEEDEIQTDVVERCCWTREEADDWCKANAHNGVYYSYSIKAEGVLEIAMNKTCEREIQRTSEHNQLMR